MPRFLVERQIPNASKLSEDERKEVVQTADKVLRELGPDVEWIETYHTDDRVFCVYNAPDKKTLAAQAEKGSFSVKNISPIKPGVDLGTIE